MTYNLVRPDSDLSMFQRSILSFNEIANRVVMLLAFIPILKLLNVIYRLSLKVSLRPMSVEVISYDSLWEIPTAFTSVFFPAFRKLVVSSDIWLYERKESRYLS